MENTLQQPASFKLLQTLSHPLFTRQSLTVQVLRTDLLHPFISGNKWMKLQPWLQKAKSAGFDKIITKGGPWSNHVHAAAYACQQEQLSFTAVIKAKDGMLTQTLADVLKWSGNIIYTQNNLYKNEAHWQQLASQQNVLYIPMGGEGPEGVQGVTDFFNTLSTPAYDYDYVICSVGTGTTLMGIAASNLPYKQLVGANPGISDPHYADIVSNLQQQLPAKSFAIKEDKALGKFGKWPAFLPEKMNDWLARWHLPTDIVYTAKMLYQFEQWLAEGYFENGSHILLVHTGGLQGNRSLPAGLLKN